MKVSAPMRKLHCIISCVAPIFLNMLSSTNSFAPVIPFGDRYLTPKQNTVNKDPITGGSPLYRRSGFGEKSSFSTSCLMRLRAKRGNDHFDMDELQRRIEEVTNSRKLSPLCYQIAEPEPDEDKPVNVNVILFKPDKEEECGVHSIEYPVGSGNNIILAFESKSECYNFAGILKEQDFFDPVPQEIKLNELEDFCSEQDVNTVRVQFVPRGIHIVPPSRSVAEVNHNPDRKDQQQMLDQLYQMSTGGYDETEPMIDKKNIEKWG